MDYFCDKIKVSIRYFFKFLKFLQDVLDLDKRCYSISIHILLTFLVKVARGLKENSTSQKFFKN